MDEIEKIDNLLKNVNEEYLLICSPILNHKEFKKRLKYHHHEDSSVFFHSLCVSILSYKIAKKLHLDYNSAAIAGLLHDFYYKDWQNNKVKVKNPLKMHGFIHASEAYFNTKKFFPQYFNDIVGDSIIKHMFPLNIRPPKYLEGWIITFSDKYVSLDVLKHPKAYYKYLGLKNKRKR